MYLIYSIFFISFDSLRYYVAHCNFKLRHDDSDKDGDDAWEEHDEDPQWLEYGQEGSTGADAGAGAGAGTKDGEASPHVSSNQASVDDTGTKKEKAGFIHRELANDVAQLREEVCLCVCARVRVGWKCTRVEYLTTFGRCRP